MFLPWQVTPFRTEAHSRSPRPQPLRQWMMLKCLLIVFSIYVWFILLFFLSNYVWTNLGSKRVSHISLKLKKFIVKVILKFLFSRLNLLRIFSLPFCNIMFFCVLASFRTNQPDDPRWFSDVDGPAAYKTSPGHLSQILYANIPVAYWWVIFFLIFIVESITDFSPRPTTNDPLFLF